MTFVFLLAGASRLARFNIQVNPQPSNPGRPGRKYFVGMPIPAGAGAMAAVVHLVQGDPLQLWWLSIGWADVLCVVAFLMVSTWRFFSLKGINFRQQQNFRWLIGHWRCDWPDLVRFRVCIVRAGVGIYPFGSAGAAFVCVPPANGAASTTTRRGLARLMKSDLTILPRRAVTVDTGAALFRVAIIGAATLKGRELKEVLSDRNFPANDIRLLDDEESLGQLQAIGEEPTFIQSVLARAPGERGLHLLRHGRCLHARSLGDGAQGRQRYHRFVVWAGRPARCAVARAVGGARTWRGAQGRLHRSPVVIAHPAAVVLALLLLRAQKIGTIVRAIATAV